MKNNAPVKKHKKTKIHEFSFLDSCFKKIHLAQKERMKRIKNLIKLIDIYEKERVEKFFRVISSEKTEIDSKTSIKRVETLDTLS